MVNKYRNRRPKTGLSSSGGYNAPLLRPLKNLYPLSQCERVFLDATEHGDKATIQAVLQEPPENFSVNCTDLLGRTALEIAVDNENVEIIELLLSHEDIKIGNALLHGIREGVYKMVEMLIDHPSITSDMLGDGWRGSLDHNDAENFEYSADISPVMLAAHLDQFEILQLLLSRGARIYKPHVAACPCDQCKEDRSSDSLQHSLKRIYTFRALASPAWISLTSNDPILTAFRLSWELQRLSRSECEFKDIYLHLSEQCKSYAVDLLSQCRSTEEVIAIMNRGNSADENQELYTPRLSLDRLKLAIKYEQKQFVSHPHCQQLLTSIWFQGFPGRRESSSMINILVTTLLIFAWPFIALIYIIYPRSKIGQMVRSPYMKFLYYSTSFSCFLLLLTLATVEDYRSNMEDDVSDNRTMNRGPPPSFVEVLIIFWVFGMLWSEMKQLWDEGFNKYLHQWWNLLDFIMIALYLCTFSLRTIAYLRFHTKYVNLANLPRQDWWSGEPMLIAESLFAIANVFSFARIIYLFQTSPYLGPLQISLGCMLIDIGKFFVIFFLILTSFAIGLVQLYWYYGKSVHCPVDASINCKKEAFSSISNSYTTLLWSLFSITKPEDTDVVEKHYFTQLAGRGMYIAYHVTSIIVLLNMLIAMMSHSFQNINDHADLEWKFHRTKLWLSYFDEGSSLPAPFNLVVSPKWMVYFTKGAVNFVKCLLFRQPLPKASRRATIKRPGRKKTDAFRHPRSSHPTEYTTYQDIMDRIISRFIHQTKKDMKLDSVNEDDLLEIKQDISSLRFELREDRRKEVMRSVKYIDGVKKEILRSLSSVGPTTVSRPSLTQTHVYLSTRSNLTGYTGKNILGDSSDQNEDIEGTNNHHRLRYILSMRKRQEDSAAEEKPKSA